MAGGQQDGDEDRADVAVVAGDEDFHVQPRTAGPHRPEANACCRMSMAYGILAIPSSGPQIRHSPRRGHEPIGAGLGRDSSQKASQVLDELVGRPGCARPKEFGACALELECRSFGEPESCSRQARLDRHALEAGGLALDRSRLAGDRLHALVPGGAHTYAKGDDQFPEGSRR